MTTSAEAHANHESSGHAASNRETILSYVRVCCAVNGQTSAEIAIATRLDRHEVARRLSEIERAGDIRRGAERPCRTNGHKMATWGPAWKTDGNTTASEQGRLF